VKGFIRVTDMRGEERIIAIAQIRVISPDTYNRVGCYVGLVDSGCIETRDSFETVAGKLQEAS